MKKERQLLEQLNENELFLAVMINNITSDKYFTCLENRCGTNMLHVKENISHKYTSTYVF